MVDVKTTTFHGLPQGCEFVQLSQRQYGTQAIPMTHCTSSAWVDREIALKALEVDLELHVFCVSNQTECTQNADEI